MGAEDPGLDVVVNCKVLPPLMRETREAEVVGRVAELVLNTN
jgi:hypothetical protein